MPLLESITNFFKNRLIYMTGRGMLSMALVGVALAVPGLSFAPLAIAAIGLTGALQGALVWRDQRNAEGRILNHYRDEIASVVGQDPSQVTIQDLHHVAKGDPEQGIEPNAVIDQAINRSGERKLLRLGSTIAAGVLALGAVFMLPGMVFEQVAGTYQSVAPFSASNAGVVSAMLVSGIGMGIINNILDYAGEHILGLNRPTAHAQINAIKLDVRRGLNVTQERVFGVFVYADPVLARSIKDGFGERYEQLDPLQQNAALREFGRYYPIDQLTQDINSRQVEPDELAFAAVGQRSGVPRKEDTKQPEKLSMIGDAVQVLSHKMDERSYQQSVNEELPAKQPSSPEQGSFVAKYAAAYEPNSITHVERELQRREALLEAMPTLGVTRH